MIYKRFLMIIVLSLTLLLTGCSNSRNKKIELKVYFIEEITKQQRLGTAFSINKSSNLAEVVMKHTNGYIFANDPDAEQRKWYATCEVYENGEKINPPNINWSTDFSQIMLVPYGERADIVQVKSFPNSQRGQGLIFAEYAGEVSSMSIKSYGLIRLEKNMGWSFANNTAVNEKEADLYFTVNSNIFFAIHAPSGIKLLNEIPLGGNATYLETIKTPTTEGFTTELPLTGSGVYEVIGQDGIHRKMLVVGILTQGFQDGTYYHCVELAWDEFEEVVEL